MGQKEDIAAGGGLQSVRGGVDADGGLRQVPAANVGTDWVTKITQTYALSLMLMDSARAWKNPLTQQGFRCKTILQTLVQAGQ